MTLTLPAWKPDQPWYQNSDYYIRLASAYMEGAHAAQKNEIARRELDSFRSFSLVSLIFESNLIEGAGVKTRGETKEIIDRHAIAIPESYEVYRRLNNMDDAINEDIIATIDNDLGKINRKRKRALYPVVQFKGQSKKAKEVIQHQNAFLYAEHLTYEYLLIQKLAKLRDHIVEWNKSSDTPIISREINDYLEKNQQTRVRRTVLFSQGNIKGIHKRLAAKLLPGSAKVPAGTYRIHDAHIDHRVKFPSPDTLKECMRHLVKSSSNCIEQFEAGNMNVFELAARISYDFVAVHPFPDFNGRLSRVLMNMALKLHDSTLLPIALRGDAKNKKNYFSSLEKCARKNYTPLAALIARRVCEIYEEYDANVQRAGQPSILTLIN